MMNVTVFWDNPTQEDMEAAKEEYKKNCDEEGYVLEADKIVEINVDGVMLEFVLKNANKNFYVKLDVEELFRRDEFWQAIERLLKIKEERQQRKRTLQQLAELI